MKNKILYLVLFALSYNAYAQLNSNFFNNNTINPASVGLKDNFNIGVKYETTGVNSSLKQGFDGNPNTFLFNAYKPINDKIALGVSYVNLKYGPFKDNFFNVDVSYKYNINENSDFLFGLKTGISNYKVSFQSLLLPDGTSFSSKINDTDFNLGIGAQYVSNNLQLGLSVPNLLQRDIENYSSDKKRISIVFTSLYKVAINDNIEFQPGMLLSKPTDDNLFYYFSADFGFKKVIHLGVNYQEDVFGIQISSPKIAGIFKLGLNIGFINTNGIKTDYNKNVAFFGNFEFPN